MHFLNHGTNDIKLTSKNYPLLFDTRPFFHPFALLEGREVSNGTRLTTGIGSSANAPMSDTFISLATGISFHLYCYGRVWQLLIYNIYRYIYRLQARSRRGQQEWTIEPRIIICPPLLYHPFLFLRFLPG